MEATLPRPTDRGPWTAAARTGPWFGLFFVLVFSGEGLGYAACRLLDTEPPHALAWLAFAGVAALIGALATVLLAWLLLDRMKHLVAEVAELRGSTVSRADMTQQAGQRLEQQRRLRHDLRGALSPVLLTADRLIAHADPKVRRSGEIIVQSVERASSLLVEPGDLSPPGDP